MKVKVIKDKCIGCGSCVAVAEEIFELDEEGKSTVIKQPENEKEKKAVREAASLCPTKAIKIEESNSDDEEDCSDDEDFEDLDYEEDYGEEYY